VEFVYPNGATLSVAAPAVPLLSTGTVAYPQKACVLAVSEDLTDAAKAARGAPRGQRAAKGRVVVVGSSALLGDEWLDKEQNAAVMAYIFATLQPVRSARSQRCSPALCARRCCE